MLLSLFLLTSFFAIAQDAKNDVVLKMNGDELVGKVQKIGDEEIEFTYAGESLVYTIKKKDIMKVTFASGRIEVFNRQSPSPETKSPASTTASPKADGLEEHHNKVAILPFRFLRDGQASNEDFDEQVQNECYSMMSKHAGVFTILNPRTTNAMLIKAGINSNTIKGYTMDDLCNILGVEYVVDGLVSMNKTTQTNIQSSSGSSTSKNNDKNNERDRRYNNYSYGTSTQSYKTSITLNISNDKGVSVFSQERTSFWATADAYKSAMEYLLKRTPLYSK